MSETSKVILSCRGLKKVFRQSSSHEVPVLHGIDLDVYRGERLSIVGASGSGKSTLLHLLGGLDTPTAGEIMLMEQNLAKVNETQRGLLRNRHLGFVYQFHHLLPEFTALENVSMPLLIRRENKQKAEEKAALVLSQVGLSHRLDHTPAELSGGERQRAAIARALVTEPACVLADEPTGNLDRKTAEAVFELMFELNETIQTSFIIVTHDHNLARRADKTLLLQDGVLCMPGDL